ncbi:MAG: M28 family metallopeptidase [Bacillota bacterium]
MRGHDKQLEDWWNQLLSFSPRMMGSKGANECVRFLIDELTKLEVGVEVHPFLYSGWELTYFSGLKMEQPVFEEIESYPALGCSSGKVVKGSLVELGETVIWDMYNWPRFGVMSQEGKLVAYISVRKGGEALSQTLIMKHHNKPHLFVGEKIYEQWKRMLGDKQEINVSFELDVIRKAEMEGQNLCVTIPPEGKKSIKKVVIGAHYDTMYNTPGAYDNTSGVAVLLSLISWIKKERLPFQVECIFFGAEEFALAGSKAYVERLSQEGIEEIEVMINLDGFGRGEELECWVGSDRIEEELWKKLSHPDSLFPSWKMISPPPPGSDHTPFYLKNIPAVMFTVNDQEILHTHRDIPTESMLHNMQKISEFLKKLLEEELSYRERDNV